MSQQTFSSGGTQVAEPPAPVLPAGDSGAGDDNRRNLMIVGAVVGVVVLALVAFFLLKGGGSSASTDSSFAVPHHTRHAAPAAQAPAVVKLPKHVAAPVGRDPFKPLYVAPAAASAPGSTGGTGSAAAGSGATQTTTSGSTATSGGTTTTTSGGTTSPVVYHPVWVKLKSLTATTATFDVGYSNNKSLKVLHYSGIKQLQTFASTFELLSVRNGAASVRYGDGSPFSLTLAHPTMIVG